MSEYLLHETQNDPYHREKSPEDTKSFSSLHFTEFFNLNDSSSSGVRVYTVAEVMSGKIHN